MEEITMESTDDGLVNFRMTPGEAKKLRSFLDRKSNGVQKPRITREGNKIIIDTGLDEYCIFNKDTPQEIHVKSVYQKAGYPVIENGEAVGHVPAITVIERIEGGFCYMDGSPVRNREDLSIIPKVHRQAALDWFDAKYPSSKEEDKENPITSVPTPGEEAELTLKDRVIIGLAKGFSGKALAEKLKCSEGTVSVHKKNAIKGKYLSKDGRKFTPTGLEKYGRIEINL